MARMRVIKPEITMDEELANLGFAARWFFINLLCHVDREGRCEDRPKVLQAKILPWDHRVDANQLLNELHPHFVLRYEVAGKRFLWIRNFLKHQRPHPQEPKSELPKPNKDNLEKPCKNIAKNVLQLEKTANMPIMGTLTLIDNGDSNSNTIGPAAPAAPKRADTDVQKVVNAYKIARNVPKDDKAWDKANYGRACKAAKTILEAFESTEKAVAYVIIKGDEFDGKDLTWTLETIARWAHDEKGRLNGNECGEVDTDGVLEFRGPTKVSPSRNGRGGPERAVACLGEAGDNVRGGNASGVPEVKPIK